MWIFWALFSAIVVALRRPLEKKVINNMHHFTFGLLVQYVSLPVLLAATLLSGAMRNPLSLGAAFWLPVLVVSTGFYPLNSYLYKQAMKNSDLSSVLPLQSLLPVFALGLAWVTLGERPSLLAAAGVLCTVLGIYALGLKGKRLHHPLTPFKQDTSSRAMLAGVLLVSFVSLLDKIALQAANPLMYSLASTIGAIITLHFSVFVSRQKLTMQLAQFAKPMELIGSLQGITYATYLLAVSMGPLAYVSALRSTNILMGSVLGILVLGETLTKAKILSYMCIVFGAMLLVYARP